MCYMETSTTQEERIALVQLVERLDDVASLRHGESELPAPVLDGHQELSKVLVLNEVARRYTVHWNVTVAVPHQDEFQELL